MIKLSIQSKQRLFSKLCCILGVLVFGMQYMHAETTIPNSGEITIDKNIQQGTTVTGVVVGSDDGVALPGVAVVVKGTTTGTVTDFDGNYTITAPSTDAVLVFSYLGYVTQEIQVGSKSVIDVTLEPDTTALDEVVVVGYGTAKKETLTGSIEQVKSEVFEDIATGSPALALQGRTPGLVITRNSSRPGDENINFLIRGASSTNGIDPLIVIDGVPAINTTSFTDMNPNDIENISVLKGGSASVYGSRAAGGVILVTTKKGKGDIKVDFSTITRMGTIGIRPPTPTMEEYGQLYLEAVDADLVAGKSPRYFFWDNHETLERIANGEEGYYDLAINGTVWMAEGNRFDEMFGNSFSTQHNFSISGGTDKSNFRISAGYDENVGGLKIADDSSDRYNFSLNYNVNVSDRLSINTNVSYFHRHISGPTGGLSRDAATYDAPLFPSYNQYGQYYSVFGGVNIAGRRNAVAQVIDGGRTNEIDEQFKISALLDYKLTDHLNVTASYAISKQNSEDQAYTLSVPLYDWDGNLATTITDQSNTYIEEETGNVVYKNYKSTLNYNNTFGDHKISGLLAVEAEKNENNGLRARRTGFVDYGVYDLNLGSTDGNITTEGGGNTWGAFGYIGRLNYNYKEKYLLEVQGRRDGSSRFADGQKWSNYFSASGGWVISSEKFLEDNNTISFLKLRGGYGELGSTSGFGNFGYLSTVSFGTTVFGQTDAGQQVTTKASSLFSDTTTWERIITKEIGVDFRLFDNHVFGSVDLYEKDNKDMLVSLVYPDLLGTGAPVTNSGTLETRGWEVQLGWNGKVGDLDISVGANMSDSRNRLTQYDGAESIQAGLNDVDDDENILGKPINSFYLYDTDGYFQTQDEVDAYYATYGGKENSILYDQSNAAGLVPGDTKIIDSNGDGVINTDDLTYHGDNSPHYTYGFNLDLKYKNWDFSTFFQGVMDQSILRTGYFSAPFQQIWQNQATTWLGTTWTPENTNARYPRSTTQRNVTNWNYINKDFMLQNNRYIRLKSLVLGYSFKDLKIGNTPINNLRIYFSGNDLFEFTSVKDGYDPEAQEGTNDATYPFMRTWALGLKVSL
ncbi:SusC/RagA family TonB-linked outer membrane protein [Maribacter polysaccharolyticus]|uniref:SusC/RagA family TonB-linked outer membrane protein n=1 Tax=Maribacter polysaccharolyticus TaxID=3020831 RepID=UPI00237F2476|nr:TonB-dependent receptor [Maribacter polysaccharolyticus]MDE3741006.1 TonB-dependent receptor [Maribacter polysaccharolyticus]